MSMKVQFTVPAKRREAPGLKPADTLLLRAVDPGRFEALAPNHSLSAFFDARVAGEASRTAWATRWGTG